MAIRAESKRSFRNFLIQPGFQGRYICWVAASGGILLAANGYMVYQFVHENLYRVLAFGTLSMLSKEEFSEQLRVLLFKVGGFSILMIAVAAILGLILSHRAAGPLVQFKRVFGQIKDGQVTSRIRLRHDDEWQDVAQSFNDMMDELSKRLKEVEK